MKTSRRRFLTIAACFAALPAGAHAETWQGRAFGADVSMTIRGDRDVAKAALASARQMINEIEALFSLYERDSALSKLNAEGILRTPPPRFLELVEAADHAHHITDGLFDPTIQPLWKSLASGGDPTGHSSAIGWHHVRFDPLQITLGRAQALTFNGIAQGFATDKVTEVLRAHGLTDILVNIGEYRGSGGPWTLSLQDPEHRDLGQRRLTTGAIATSSPKATPLGRNGHIIHKTAQPQWSTVTVEAATATLADSLSTGMVLAPRDQIAAIKTRTEITRVTLVDFNGDLTTL